LVQALDIWVNATEYCAPHYNYGILVVMPRRHVEDAPPKLAEGAMNYKSIPLSSTFNYRFGRATVTTFAAAVSIFGPLLLDSQSTIAETTNNIKFQDVGPIEPIKEGEFRFGGTDRMFLVEDQWEFDRCTRLLPKLPKVELQKKESLLIIMSWKSMPRLLDSVRAEGDTLVVRVTQARPARSETLDYHPPTFLIFKIPAWPGPVRFDVNGKIQFTIPRGKALADKSSEIWEEILRIHSGGGGTLSEKVRYYKRYWLDMTEDEVRTTIITHEKDKFRNLDLDKLYPLVFDDLIAIRATPAIPRIFELIQTMAPHDKALGPAKGALVAIGGPDVVEGCKKALVSTNTQSRRAAMGILATFALPETRQLARDKLIDRDDHVSVTAFMLLQNIGIGKVDVPAMVKGLEGAKAYYMSPGDFPEKRPYGYNGELPRRLIFSFGELGPSARDALPILKEVASEPTLRGFREDAVKAIVKIE
jgi:hypothetical protein